MEEKKLVSIECHEYFKNLRRATNFNIERSNTLLVANESAIKAATDDYSRVDLVASYVESDEYRNCKDNGGVLVAFLRYIGLNDIVKGARAPRNVSAPAMPSHDTSDDDATSDDLQKAAALLALLKGNNKPATIDAESVRAIVADEIEKAAGRLVVSHEIKIADAAPAKVDGVVCDKYDEIMTNIANGISVYMYGPSGTGKSYTARQIAAALDRVPGETFLPVAKVSYAEQITGYMNAAGVYVPGALYKAMKNGALLFIDEIDASDPAALVAINDAIASKAYTFPNLEYVTAAPGFVVIAAGNTTGHGADNVYTGRNAIDAATLNRFFKTRVDYDVRIENALTGNNAALVDFVHTCRKAAINAGYDLILSYRTLEMIATLEKTTMPLDSIVDGAILQGMSKDDARRVFASLDDGNKYAAATRKAIAKLAC